MHAFGMRLSLGRTEGSISVSLPLIDLRARWKGPVRARPEASRSLRKQSAELETPVGARSGIHGADRMTGVKQTVIHWLDYRTGVETAIKNFLYEEVPASSGWHQVFGSVAV